MHGCYTMNCSRSKHRSLQFILKQLEEGHLGVQESAEKRLPVLGTLCSAGPEVGLWFAFIRSGRRWRCSSSGEKATGRPCVRCPHCS